MKKKCNHHFHSAGQEKYLYGLRLRIRWANSARYEWFQLSCALVQDQDNFLYIIDPKCNNNPKFSNNLRIIRLLFYVQCFTTVVLLQYLVNLFTFALISVLHWNLLIFLLTVGRSSHYRPDSVAGQWWRSRFRRGYFELLRNSSNEVRILWLGLNVFSVLYARPYCIFWTLNHKLLIPYYCWRLVEFLSYRVSFFVHSSLKLKTKSCDVLLTCFLFQIFRIPIRYLIWFTK